MTSFIINCRNCNDDPEWVTILPGHTRLSCPKDAKCPSILDLIRSKNPQTVENVQQRPILFRSHNRHFTNSEKIYYKETFEKRLEAVIKIQKFVKKSQRTGCT